MTPFPELPFVAGGEDEVELTVVDLGVARALWEGVPTGRLLARARLDRDERDLVDFDQRASGVDFADASWDIVLARLLASAPACLDRVKRAVARHAHAAAAEGPLAASDTSIAALVHALLSSADADASPAEGAADALDVDEPVRAASASFDQRLARSRRERRAAYFEACLALAQRSSAPGCPLDALRSSLGAIEAMQEADIHDSGGYPSLDALPDAVVASEAILYPWGADGEVTAADARVCLLDRGRVERIVLRERRHLSAAVVRAEARYPTVPIARIVADISPCLGAHGALLLVAKRREPRSAHDASLPPGSWAPSAIDTPETAAALAAALERGSITAPRARSLLVRGGDAALDAIGKEMLDVAAHPFASAVFAEILAPIARERDVVRLVTYFAIAPDPAVAARALSVCGAPEVVCAMLKSWLETMLPPDGAPLAPGTDPETSAGARVNSCIGALRPYPTLYDAVRPLLTRLGEHAADGAP